MEILINTKRVIIDNLNFESDLELSPSDKKSIIRFLLDKDSDRLLGDTGLGEYVTFISSTKPKEAHRIALAFYKKDIIEALRNTWENTEKPRMFEFYYDGSHKLLHGASKREDILYHYNFTIPSVVCRKFTFDKLYSGYMIERDIDSYAFDITINEIKEIIDIITDENDEVQDYHKYGFSYEISTKSIYCHHGDTESVIRLEYKNDEWFIYSNYDCGVPINKLKNYLNKIY